MTCVQSTSESMYCYRHSLQTLASHLHSWLPHSQTEIMQSLQFLSSAAGLIACLNRLSRPEPGLEVHVFLQGLLSNCLCKLGI